MGNTKLVSHENTIRLSSCLIAYAAAGACPSDGYWHFHTRNTLKDPNFGAFDCLNAGLPCGKAKTESAAKAAVKAAWTKAGGKSYKYMANGYCPSQVSQSNIWQTGKVTWKFSKLKSQKTWSLPIRRILAFPYQKHLEGPQLRTLRLFERWSPMR